MSAVRRLSVYMAGTKAGTLRQHVDGARSFSYEKSYDGAPLSLAMPVSDRTYAKRVVDAYLMGLLPDDGQVRRLVGLEFGVSSNNPLAMLAYRGLDCAGAVQFLPEEGEHSYVGAGHPNTGEELVPLTEEQIAERLRPAIRGDAGIWLREGECRSLAGCQPKFALRVKDGRWYECHGTAATTHVLKPGVSGMRLQALDEFVTMRLAEKCNIPSEHVDYLQFCGVPAIVATRYDRLATPGGIMRIHQEDFCQALSVSPRKKYAEDGGPSTPDMLRVLRKTTDPARNTELFATMLFFNYLTASPDAHAKNYSLLHPAPGICELAPLYDAASALPYDPAPASPHYPLHNSLHDSLYNPQHDPAPERVQHQAMPIGRENRVGHVGREDIACFADTAQMDRERCVGLMAGLCERIIKCASSAADDALATGADGADELVERLLPRLESHCRATLRRL